MIFLDGTSFRRIHHENSLHWFILGSLSTEGREGWRQEVREGGMERGRQVGWPADSLTDSLTYSLTHSLDR